MPRLLIASMPLPIGGTHRTFAGARRGGALLGHRSLFRVRPPGAVHIIKSVTVEHCLEATGTPLGSSPVGLLSPLASSRDTCWLCQCQLVETLALAATLFQANVFKVSKLLSYASSCWK